MKAASIWDSPRIEAEAHRALDLAARVAEAKIAPEAFVEPDNLAGLKRFMLGRPLLAKLTIWLLRNGMARQAVAIARRRRGGHAD